MLEKEAYEKVKNAARKGAAVGAAVVAMATMAGKSNAQPTEKTETTSAHAFSMEQYKDPYQFAAGVLHEMNTGPRNKNIVCNCAVVLPEGTPLNKAPMEALDHRVPKGKGLIVQRFRLREQGGDLWAAAWQARAPWTNQASDVKRYIWVNLTEAAKRPGYQVYNYANYNPDSSDVYPFTFPVAADHKNNLMVISPSTVTHSNEIAVPTIEPKAFMSTELSGLGLVPAQRPVRFIPASPIAPINPPSAYRH